MGNDYIVLSIYRIVLSLVALGGCSQRVSMII